ncbi:ABC transporter ATP-binding protein [Nisaea nitritireducens]|uniref:ABC transporter ATP-binding protein n=1 Tax=Nisaea nitritireducens TaxID=568392 RepID=UPI001866FA67|nr:ABC transporter ATP-binding protein [Nisaea nitritireducens]
MLEVRDISVSYGLHEALHGVSITVEPGEIVVILGANGAGKSSLLRAIAGVSDGKVSGVASLNAKALIGQKPDRVVETGLALVPEGRGIFGALSVGENLTLGAYPARARAAEKDNLAKVLELFPKLKDRRAQIVRTMSGGEQQMVAIGRAIMSNPDILLLDEPSLGLSPILCQELFRNLAKIRDTGMGILLVEQNARQSLAIANRGYLIENGQITGAGSAAELANDPAVQKAYLGATSI